MIYQPSDDSYLLLEQVKKYAKNKSVLDIGSGSGILALSALKAGASSVLASDISKESVNHLKSLKIKAICSDLFSKIKGKFDLIVFNPPYLPMDKREDEESRKATTGGKNGDEIILRFLKQVIRHLNKNGITLLLISSLTPRFEINALLKKQKMKYKIIAKKNLFFEKLEVLKITKIANKKV